jgi:nucleoside-diphosphate-sugar epimerase/ubiquinone/menaquinone biosynthesis C-methylase UbiE
VAVIGSSGYIGSRLLSSLRGMKHSRTIGFDRIHPGRAANEISTAELQSFESVVYLGGFTGRVMCQDEPDQVQAENVEDIVALSKRMLPSQLLVFASTSALAEGYGDTPMKEDDTLRTEGYDLYAASMQRREGALKARSSDSDSPKLIGLRFGTVVGLSDSQRTDFVHLAMTCSAFSTGRIKLGHPESHRAMLWMEDLQRFFLKLLRTPHKDLPQFDVYHIASFGTGVAKVANTIASRTSAEVVAKDHAGANDSVGFHLDTSKAQQKFEFEFKGSQPIVLDQLQSDVPRMCVGRTSRVAHDSVPCVVCGHKHMVDVLDLHTQPLANDFRSSAEEAAKCERFPLKLVRCPRCFHSQLSYLVDRGYLFSHYLYASGTSASLQVHFSWLAEKIISESAHSQAGQVGTILEIASNDGSQLDQFKKRGWKTIGVDPAANIAETAKAKGHTIHVGFWSVDTFPLPPANEIDAIVAQNVFAHVFDPTEFLRAAFRTMGPNTKLYLQTSQCEMYESGQFDTVYHEHVSFFTAHSFRYAAALAGLKVRSREERNKRREDQGSQARGLSGFRFCLVGFSSSLLVFRLLYDY